jgi:hypothetical protein
MVILVQLRDEVRGDLLKRIEFDGVFNVFVRVDVARIEFLHAHSSDQTVRSDLNTHGFVIVHHNATPALDETFQLVYVLVFKVRDVKHFKVNMKLTYSLELCQAGAVKTRKVVCWHSRAQ